MPGPNARTTKHVRRTEKREQAAARNEARAQRSTIDQLAALVARGAEYCEEANQIRARLGLTALNSEW